MWTTCLQKQQQLKTLFSGCLDDESKYQKIIELGRKGKPLDSLFKIPENLVKGCQSTVYLRSYLKEGKVFFETESDALISAGLAALLAMVYSEETPETILQCPPTFLEEIGIAGALTPHRANGLYSIHLRMKQEALAYYPRNGD